VKRGTPERKKPGRKNSPEVFGTCARWSHIGSGGLFVL
jgi:hypothetical protein